MRYISSWIILLVLIVLASCSTERQLATKFVTEEENIHVLLLPPSGLIKTFLPVHPDSLPADSVIDQDLDQAKFLQEINDTAYVNYFMRSLAYHLQFFQVKVYDQSSLDAFMALEENAYIFALGQMELMEFNDTMFMTAYADYTWYSIALARTNVEQNNWFEFSDVKDEQGRMHVLFSSQLTSDYFEGEFRRSWSEPDVTYEYTPFRLTQDDVYDLAYFSGRRNAQYIFDYLMNYYVKKKLKGKREPAVYFQYDRSRHALRRAEGDRFYIMSVSGEDQDL
jgi:hypothetical protein